MIAFLSLSPLSPLLLSPLSFSLPSDLLGLMPRVRTVLFVLFSVSPMLVCLENPDFSGPTTPITHTLSLLHRRTHGEERERERVNKDVVHAGLPPINPSPCLVETRESEIDAKKDGNCGASHSQDSDTWVNIYPKHSIQLA